MCGSGRTYMCAIFEGTISLSSPTSALPVARIRFSPFAVSGMSDVPVWRPLSDQSVSPCRIMKARGVVIGGRNGGEVKSEERDSCRMKGMKPQIWQESWATLSRDFDWMLDLCIYPEISHHQEREY